MKNKTHTVGTGEGERDRRREILKRTPNFAVKRKNSFFEMGWTNYLFYFGLQSKNQRILEMREEVYWK